MYRKVAKMKKKKICKDTNRLLVPVRVRRVLKLKIG